MIAGKSQISMVIGSPLNNAVCVDRVTGGEETNPLWTSEVDNESFRKALVGSLRDNQLHAAAGAYEYKLNANLLGLAQPIGGFDLTVTANVNYEVLAAVTAEPYYQTTVTTPYTADFSSAFAAIKRLRLANEGAIKANITKFMNELLLHTPPTVAPSAPASTAKPTS